MVFCYKDDPLSACEKIMLYIQTCLCCVMFSWCHAHLATMTASAEVLIFSPSVSASNRNITGRKCANFRV